MIDIDAEGCNMLHNWRSLTAPTLLDTWCTCRIVNIRVYLQDAESSHHGVLQLSDGLSSADLQVDMHMVASTGRRLQFFS